MIIVFTAQGTDWTSPMDPRFGRTRWFLVHDEAKDGLVAVDNADGDEAHGAGPRTARQLIDLGADVLITGNGPGGNAAAVLATTGIEVWIGAGDLTVAGALESYRAGRLTRAS